MNREEMLERLKAGEKPIDVAIAKWVEGIEKEEYESLDSPTNCALCYTSNPKGKSFEFDCDKCVLNEIDERCPYDHATFSRFVDTLEQYLDGNADLDDVHDSAECMLDVLKRAKAYLIEHYRY